MQIDELNTDAAVLAELGRRLERHRLERNLTQAEIAADAGLGQATIQRAERGESVQMTSMIKLLRALGLLSGLELAIPASIDLPIAQLEREQHRASRTRQRARGGARTRDARESGARARRHTRAEGAAEADGRSEPATPSKSSADAASTEPAEERWTWGDEPGQRA
jgi:transcriptional regulator with XRE-family HTH domain